MAKLVLPSTNSGYNLSQINNNFQTIVDYINNNSLARANPTADANQLLVPLDMNGNRIINLPLPVDLNEAVRLQDLYNAAFGTLPPLAAGNISVTPVGTIASTNVQSAIAELDGDGTALRTRMTTAEGNITTNTGNISTLNTSVANLTTAINQKTVVLPTIANIKTLSKTVNPFAFVQGYYTPGDGGGGQYYYDAADTTTSDNGGTVIVANDGGRWKLVRNGNLKLRQFGAKGDATTDDTSAINRALAALGVGVLEIGSGTFNTTGGHVLLNGQYILGAGQFATIFACTSNTADVITSAGNYIGIKDLSFKGLSSRTAGRFFATTGLQGSPCIIENIYCENYVIGIEVNSSRVYMKNLTFINAAVTNAIPINLAAATEVVIDTVSSDTSINPAYGVLIQQAAGVWISNSDFIHCSVGIQVSPTSSQTCSDLYFNNVACDSSTNIGWNFVTSGTTQINRVTMTGCWGSSSTNGGMITTGSGGVIDTILITNSQFVNNGKEGINLQTNVRNVSISNSTLSGNSQTTNNGFYGLAIGAGVSSIKIIGNRLGPTQSFADRELAQIGIATGASDRLVIALNDLTTSHVAITNGSTGTHNVIVNNVT